jgi:DNA-directed RNA polymerase sigma subunit (sigma70/sigma32)
MSTKLGYTFYPKDFISDPDVMMMNPNERGIYRDLIDLAYMNDNEIKYTLTQLAKYCNATEKEVEQILLLKGKQVGKIWTIPSCNKRMIKILSNRDNGGKGGRPKKPKQNPNDNPINNPSETQTERQIEIESKIKEIKKEIINSQSWIEQIAKNKFLTLEKCKDYLNRFLSDAELKDEINDLSDTKKHFVNWLNIELKKEAPDKEAAKRKEAPDMDWLRGWEEKS